VEQRSEEEYSSAMKGKKMPEKTATMTLKGEVTKLRKISSGEESGDDNSISSRLRYILEAINSTPPDINLEINSITVSEGMMRIDGSTNSRANTQKLLSAIDKHSKLKRAQESLQQKGSVDSFSVNIDFVK
jgi:histidyl-tRNA synthetase